MYFLWRYWKSNLWILGARVNGYLRDALSHSEAAHSCAFPDGELPGVGNKMFSMDALYLWNPFLPGLAESKSLGRPQSLFQDLSF